MSINTVGSARKDLSACTRAIAGSSREGRGGSMVAHMGHAVAIHSTPPPHVSEYAEWFTSALSDKKNGKPKLTPEKLRRMVVMRRQGSSLTECGRAAGISNNCASRWLADLPERLRP